MNEIFISLLFGPIWNEKKVILFPSGQKFLEGEFQYKF
jgi:hypothetical protein